MNKECLKLAFYGKAGCGKDFIARKISRDFHCKENLFAFADPLKRQLADLIGMTSDERKLFKTSEDFKNNTYFNISTHEIKHIDDLPCNRNIITASDWFFDILNEEEGGALVFSPGVENMWISLRELCVYYGTYIMQKFFGKDIWIKSVINTPEFKKAVKMEKIVMITDVRFPLEYKILKERGFKFIHIIRDYDVPEIDNIAESYYNDFTADIEYHNYTGSAENEIFLSKKNYAELIDKIKNLKK